MAGKPEILGTRLSFLWPKFIQSREVVLSAGCVERAPALPVRPGRLADSAAEKLRLEGKALPLRLALNHCHCCHTSDLVVVRRTAGCPGSNGSREPSRVCEIGASIPREPTSRPVVVSNQLYNGGRNAYGRCLTDPGLYFVVVSHELTKPTREFVLPYILGLMRVT